MKKTKKILHKLFIIFLFVYIVFMVYHAREIDWNIKNTIIFILGFVFAILAHAKKNYITIIILSTHMIIEWLEWSHLQMNNHVIVLNTIHIIMDFAFISHELKAHVAKYRKLVLSTLGIIFVSILAFGHLVPIENNVFATMEPFVLAGVIGCIITHLFFHITKEKIE